MDLEICFEIRRIDFHHSQWSCQGMWHMTLGLFKRLSHEAIRDELKSKLKWINKQNTIDWSDTIIDTVQERLWLRDTESVSRAPIKHVAVAAIYINDLLTNSSSLSLCVSCYVAGVYICDAIVRTSTSRREERWASREMNLRKGTVWVEDTTGEQMKMLLHNFETRIAPCEFCVLVSQPYTICECVDCVLDLIPYHSLSLVHAWVGAVCDWCVRVTLSVTLICVLHCCLLPYCLSSSVRSIRNFLSANQQINPNALLCR